MRSRPSFLLEATTRPSPHQAPLFFLARKSANLQPDDLRTGKARCPRVRAEACSGTDTYLFPLLGGTLSVFPQALYGDVSWQDALESTLAEPSLKALSGGRAGRRTIFCCCNCRRPWVVDRSANPSANATLSTPLRKVLLPFGKCSTRKFGTPSHLKQKSS